MRLCANENIPEDGVRLLRQSGHDVVWIREVAPGITDADVLVRAFGDGRLLITFDKDFGELVFLRGDSRIARSHPFSRFARVAANCSQTSGRCPGIARRLGWPL